MQLSRGAMSAARSCLLTTAVKWVSSLVSVMRVLMILFLHAGWCAVKARSADQGAPSQCHPAGRRQSAPQRLVRRAGDRIIAVGFTAHHQGGGGEQVRR